MPKLSCEISASLMTALDSRQRQTGEAIDHLVMRALADALQVDHATLFQISTAGALIEGVTGGGHLLACGGVSVRAEVQHLSDFRMAIPETAAFLAADLTGDPSAALDTAEKESS